MIDFEEEVKTALESNVDLSEEEYAKMCAAADESTKQHGVQGVAPISEEQRHKRIESNFYATALNILVNIYQLTAEIADRIKELGNGRNGKNE